jgi:hypothetical protein
VTAVRPNIFNRLQCETDDAAGHVETGLALQTDRLEREGVGRASDEKVAAAADTDGSIAADAAVIAAQLARSDAGNRCRNAPAEFCLLGSTQFNAIATDLRHVGIRATAFSVENTLKLGRRGDNHADVRTAVATKDANLVRLLGVRSRE